MRKYLTVGTARATEARNRRSTQVAGPAKPPTAKKSAGKTPAPATSPPPSASEVEAQALTPSICREKRSSTSAPLMRGFGRGQIQGNLVGDANSIAFQSHNLFRMIGNHANVFQSQVDQYLRAGAAFVLQPYAAEPLLDPVARGYENESWAMRQGFPACQS